MSKEDRRKVIKVICGLLGIMMIFTGLLFFWFGRDNIKDVITDRKAAYSALEVGLEDLHPGDHVTLDISVAADYVLQRTETLSSKGYVNYETTWRYYLIPVVKSDDQRIYLDHMVLVSKKGKYKELNEASDAFFEWWGSEDISMDTFPSETVLSVDGRVERLTSEELQYVKDYFGDMDYRSIVAPYVVKPLWDEEGRETVLVLVGMDVAGLALGVILLTFALLFGRKKGTPKKAVNSNRGVSAAQEAVQVNPAQVTAEPTTPAKPQFEDLREDPPRFRQYMLDKVNQLSAEQKAEVLNLIGSGQTIQAIKLFREMTGVGLAYAKETIDHYEEYLQ